MSLNVGLLRASFEQATPIADKVADKFYELLFADFPAVVPLFAAANMAAQKKALMGSLVFIVDNLENTEKLLDYLHNMGRRHVNHKVEFPHYEAVGATLLKTFAHFFGSAWTSQLHNAWVDAYNLIASAMKEGMAQAAGVSAPASSNVVPIASAASNPTPMTPAASTGFALPASFLNELRTAVRDEIKAAVQAEIDAIIREELASLTATSVAASLKKAG